MSLTLITNHHERALLTWHDLSPREREDVDYLDADGREQYRLFRYRGSVYDAHEFERAPHDVARLGFDGVQTDSYFSATVICFFDGDGYEREGVVVGRIHW